MTAIANNDPFHDLESNVKGYVRSFPFVIERAKGSTITAEDGTEYLDFLAGAGTLNYGHNNDNFKQALIDYIESDGIVHGLDMMSQAKHRFIDTFDEVILKPRGLEYRLQFCGPTGTNSVEAALKLARMNTGRTGILSFANGFHGMTQGALSVTGNNYHKQGIPGTCGCYTSFMPYCGYSDSVEDSISYIRQYLEDNSSGVNLPAAMILETVQGEGGVNVASMEWLRGIRNLCDEFDILMIVDDIQMGCGRTGTFFSFEEAGIEPDIVLLSKSIGAYGLPMALVLLKPELDMWKPAQHNGTFRGHNLAFVAATEALEHYWREEEFANEVQQKAQHIEKRLQAIADQAPEFDFEVRGRGFVWALESLKTPEIADKIQQNCFDHHLIIETCGSKGQALKLLPALTASEAELNRGLDIIEKAVKQLAEEHNHTHFNGADVETVLAAN